MLEECSRGLFRVHLRAANLTDSLFSALQDADSSSVSRLNLKVTFFDGHFPPKAIGFSNECSVFRFIKRQSGIGCI